MMNRSPTSRFQWPAFRGRCRRNLLAGLALSLLALGYGTWAGASFRTRGAERGAFDRPLVAAAAAMVRPPAHLRDVKPRNDRELYLVFLIADQHDVMLGLVVLALRMIATVTVGSLGLVLLSAGATEWEIRSEAVAPAAA